MPPFNLSRQVKGGLFDGVHAADTVAIYTANTPSKTFSTKKLYTLWDTLILYIQVCLANLDTDSSDSAQ